MKVVEDAVAKFAQDTRHRDRHLQQDKQIHALIRKLLVTQVGHMASWKQVYPFVANDMEAIEFRAPGSLELYSQRDHHLPIEFFQALFKDTTNVENSLLDEFQSKTQCPIEDRLVLYFMGPHAKAETLEKLYKGDEFLRKRRELAKSIESFQSELVETGNENELIIQLGTLINDIELPTEIYIVAIEENSKNKNNSVAKDVTTPSGEKEEPLKVVNFKTEQPKDHEEWQKDVNPILREYRKQQQVGAFFPVHHLARQCLILAAAPHATHQLQEHLGKRQYVEKLALPRQMAPNTNEWQTVLGFVDTLPTETVQKLVHTNQVQDYVRMALPSSAQTLSAQQILKDVIHFYATPKTAENMTKRERSFQKRHPILNNEIVQTILKV